ncbi:MAG TPA: hypothetical protein VH558_12305 [Pseudolabrys sp.]|jgi:hypothetical protein
MRTILISLTAFFSLAFAGVPRAEQHMFLVANDADGYGIDRCLASGEKCGAAAANAYCRTQAFTFAATYHKIEESDLTEATTKNTSRDCKAGRCDVVAIVCLR